MDRRGQSKPPAALDHPKFALSRQRLQLLRQIDAMSETPMAILGLVWFGLMVVDLTGDLGQAGQNVVTVIWVIFIVDFIISLVLAPRKLAYIRKNWLTVIALVLPALRMVRFLRVLRSLSRLRGLPVVRIIASINRGMRALGDTMQRRGFVYVLAITAVVTVAGAAGMLHFEGAVSGDRGIEDFWSALWWTGMIMVTMGSEYWPRTGEGRVLCMMLAIYAFAVFGYVTGIIATYFIGQDQAAGTSADTVAALEALRAEVAALRTEMVQRRAERS